MTRITEVNARHTEGPNSSSLPQGSPEPHPQELLTWLTSAWLVARHKDMIAKGRDKPMNSFVFVVGPQESPTRDWYGLSRACPSGVNEAPPCEFSRDGGNQKSTSHPFTILSPLASGIPHHGTLSHPSQQLTGFSGTRNPLKLLVVFCM